jgi:RimJ/RimL family protein N-acetyltransferase
MLKFTHTPVIKTERLILRKPNRGDIGDFMEYYDPAHDMAFMGGTLPSAEAVFDSILKAELTWVIELADEGKVIGEVYVNNIVSFYLANIGILINENYRNKGYAREALTAVKKYAFNELGLGRVRAVVLNTNTGSVRMLESCGFECEALIYDYDCGGRLADVYLFSAVPV